MGFSRNIAAEKYPKQGKFINRTCRVRFGDTQELPGLIVRDDVAEPWITIIRLVDGRHVLSTECQYSPD